MKFNTITHRQFFLQYEGAKRDDIKWPELERRQDMDDHWCIDNFGCCYIEGNQEPEQPQWPPAIEPGWTELYRKVDGFVECERWLVQ